MSLKAQSHLRPLERFILVPDDRRHALVHSDAHEHPTDELAVDLPRGRGAKLKADLCTQDVDRVQKLLLLRLGLAQQLAAPLGRSRSGQELRFLGVVLGTRGAESRWIQAASWVLGSLLPGATFCRRAGKTEARTAYLVPTAFTMSSATKSAPARAVSDDSTASRLGPLLEGCRGRS